MVSELGGAAGGIVTVAMAASGSLTVARRYYIDICNVSESLHPCVRGLTKTNITTHHHAFFA